jgi:cell wall-associated NlpC family hydrolase
MKKVLAIPLFLLLAACGSAPPKVAEVAPAVPSAPVRQGNPAINDMTFYAMSLDGTPYQPGGETPLEGFDCSGFVQHVFDHTLGVKLPRTSREMAGMGQQVDIRLLVPGDLVFFKTTGKPYSHVGIYLGDSQFIHAPRVGGAIRIEKLSARYWRSRYNGARRLLA